MTGPARGYYDARGRWISTSYSTDDRVDDSGRWNDAPRDIRQREAWLEARIANARDDGTLTSHEARRSMRTLSSIRQRESHMRDSSGRLSRRETAFIMSQLDNLSQRVRFQMNS